MRLQKAIGISEREPNLLQVRLSSISFGNHLFIEAVNGPIRNHRVSNIQMVAAKVFSNAAVKALVNRVRSFIVSRAMAQHRTVRVSDEHANRAVQTKFC